MKKLLVIKNKKLFIGVFALALASIIGVGIYVNNTSSNKSSASTPENETDSSESKYESILPSVELMSQGYACEFAKVYAPEEDIEPGKCTPIYSNNDVIVGYSVEYLKDETPYGYINLDFTKEESPVLEYCINEGSNSMYDALAKDFSDKTNNVEISDCTNKLYNINGLDYAISAKNGNEDNELYYLAEDTYEGENIQEVLEQVNEESNNSSNEINEEKLEDEVEPIDKNKPVENKTDNDEDEKLSSKESTSRQSTSGVKTSGDVEKEVTEEKALNGFEKWLKNTMPNYYEDHYGKEKWKKPKMYNNHEEVFKTNSDLIGQVDKEKYIKQYSKEKSLVSDKDIMLGTKKYNCAVVALTEVAMQEGIGENNNPIDTFNRIWYIAGNTKSDEGTDTYYGTTVQFSGCDPTYYSQIMSLYAKKYKKVLRSQQYYDAEFDLFRKAIDLNWSSTLGYTPGDIGSPGHEVNVVGYRQAHLRNHDINYLIVANGYHNDAPRYIQYEYYLFKIASITTFHFVDKK